MTNTSTDDEQKPFVAPCHKLPISAPLRWLKLGWKDVLAAPRVSLTYGLIMTLISYAITLAAWRYGNLGLFLGLVSGFVFVGPLLALTLYDISARLEQALPVSVINSTRDAFAQLSNAMLYTVILLIVFLIWARAASMIHIFMPLEHDAPLGQLTLFLSVGTTVGAVFCTVIFITSAFSLPMIIDRKTDMITAVITSANAVLRNKPTLLFWGILIVGLTAIGFATAYLGFIVILPLLGHATWHGYKEAINADEWPVNERQ